MQANEDEEEERWRRIEENHLHASTPLHVKSEREETLKGVLEAEAKERAWRMSEDGIQSMSGRSKYADDSRKAINAEFAKIVWPGVESWAPAGESEVILPPSRSRQNPAAVLYFCLHQRNLLHSPRRRLVALEVSQPKCHTICCSQNCDAHTWDQHSMIYSQYINSCWCSVHICTDVLRISHLRL